MNVMLGAVIVASLLGSVHCAGMCGPLALLATLGPATRAQQLLRTIAYHGGRLLGYSLLGLLAGSFGAAMDWGTALAGWQRSAALVAGASMVLLGAASLAQWWSGKPAHFALPRPIQRVLESLHRRIRGWTPLGRSLGVGLLTVMLPCGWLYAFLITAAGTAHPVHGLLVMVAFWIGTVPSLTLVTLGLREIAGRFRAYMPAVAACLLMATGLFTFVVRAQAHVEQLVSRETINQAEQLERVAGLADQRMPCCHADGSR